MKKNLFVICVTTLWCIFAHASPAKITEGAYGYGLENMKGELVLPCIFDKITAPATDSLPYLLELKGKYGFVDANGLFVTAVEFDRASPFRSTRKGNFLAEVQKEGRWNYIDAKGVPLFVHGTSDRYELNAFETLADFYLNFRKKHPQVDPKEPYVPYLMRFADLQMSRFNLRGSVEPLEAYKRRTIRSELERYNEKFLKIAQERYNSEHAPTEKKLKISDFTLSPFDPDNGTALINHPVWGDFIIPISHDKWREFKKDWDSGKIEICNIKSALTSDGNNLFIQEISFYSDGLNRKFTNTPSGRYSEKTYTISASGNIDIDDIVALKHIPTPPYGPGGGDGPDDSDVDRNIPLVDGEPAKNKFALIIAIENYKYASKVNWAIHDGSIFKTYCEKTLRIPESNIVLLKDATGGEFKHEITQICQKVKRSGKNTEIIFYYAGHGITNPKDHEAYLVPKDIAGEQISDDGIKQNELFKQLADTNASRIIVFLDSCFSGNSLNRIEGDRGIKVVPPKSKTHGKMVVFSAASKTESSHPYNSKYHGIFTYFLLKNLQETRGDITLRELSEYLTKHVGDTAFREHNAQQNPVATGSSAFPGWENTKLR